MGLIFMMGYLTSISLSLRLTISTLLPSGLEITVLWLSRLESVLVLSAFTLMTGAVTSLGDLPLECLLTNELFKFLGMPADLMDPFERTDPGLLESRDACRLFLLLPDLLTTREPFLEPTLDMILLVMFESISSSRGRSKQGNTSRMNLMRPFSKGLTES